MITVYTCILNGWDNLWSPTKPASDIRYLCFTDEPLEKAGRWQLKPAWRPLPDDRRNSRLPKMLPHLHFDSAYSIWVDGCLQMHADPAALVTDWLGDADIALYRHPCRQSVYAEAGFCCDQKIGESALIASQVERYKKRGLPQSVGLWAGGVIIRRHSPRVERFNEMWWGEYLHGSTRDQIALPYALWASGLSIRTIDGNVLEDQDNFEFMFHGYAGFEHLKRNPEFAQSRALMEQRKLRIAELCQ